MKQQAVVITGSGGVGSALAKKFLELNFKVVLASRSNKNDFVGNSNFNFISCDVLNNVEVENVFSYVKKQDWDLHACIHTAISEVETKKSLDLTLEEFKDYFSVDVFGGFSVFTQAAKIMKQQKHGTLIGIGSVYTEPQVHHPALAGYISAKYALRGLLKEMAKELAADNVRVNMVAPGFMPVGLNSDTPPQAVEFLRQKSLMDRLVTPLDVSNVIAFLCSNDASSLTGLFIPICLGESMTL